MADSDNPALSESENEEQDLVTREELTARLGDLSHKLESQEERLVARISGLLKKVKGVFCFVAGGPQTI